MCEYHQTNDLVKNKKSNRLPFVEKVQSLTDMALDLIYIVCGYVLNMSSKKVQPTSTPEKVISQLDRGSLKQVPLNLIEPDDTNDKAKLYFKSHRVMESNRDTLHHLIQNGHMIMISDLSQYVYQPITGYHLKQNKMHGFPLNFKHKITQVWFYVTARYLVPVQTNGSTELFRIVDCIGQSKLIVEGNVLIDYTRKQSLMIDKLQNNIPVPDVPIHTITFTDPRLIDDSDLSRCAGIENAVNFSGINRAQLDIDLCLFDSSDIDLETLVLHVGAFAVNLKMEKEGAIVLRYSN